MHEIREPRGLTFWVPPTPTGSESGASARSSFPNRDRIFASSTDFPSRSYGVCLKSLFYYCRGFFLLGLSGGAAAASYYTGKNVTDDNAKDYITATVFLATAAVVAMALTIRHFCVGRSAEATTDELSPGERINDSGYNQLRL